MSDLQPRGPAVSDWTVDVADRIESVVTTVRDKTTVPATKLARTIVFGVVAAGLAVVALVLLTVAALRLHVYFPFQPEGRKLWLAYAILGAIFLLGGAFCWRKRRAETP